MDLMDYRRKIIMSSPHLSHAEGAVATFSDGTDLPLKSLLVNIEPVQSGSGDPSPSNERPISGWGAANVTGTGKNLFNKTATDTNNGYVANKYISSTNVATSNNSYNISEYIPIKGNTQYTLNPVSGTNPSVCFYDSAKAFISGVKYNTTPLIAFTFTTPSNATYIRISIPKSSVDALQIELGSTASDFEPYTGTSVTISLGQTVYGGTLNVLTGVLTVDMQIITGNANWGNYWNSHKAEQVDTNKRASFMLSLTNETVYAQRASAKCNMLIHDTVVLNGLGNKSAFCLHPTLGRYLYACLPLDTLGMSSATSATSDADFKNAIKAMGDNLQIVIPLASPQTYTLDPQTVRSLVGHNNIFSDTGNVALDYWAHP